MDKDPIHQHEGKWFFWDELWSHREGPFDTEADAGAALVQYVSDNDLGPTRPDHIGVSVSESGKVRRSLVPGPVRPSPVRHKAEQTLRPQCEAHNEHGIHCYWEEDHDGDHEGTGAGADATVSWPS